MVFLGAGFYNTIETDANALPILPLAHFENNPESDIIEL